MAGLSQDNLLKDVFNREVVRDLGRRIKAEHPDFAAGRFEKECVGAFRDLAFLERSHHLRDMLRKYLPADFKRALGILLKTQGEPIPPGETVWENFYIISLCSFVSTYGREHFELSMKALYEFTQRFSAEGDLRVFLDVDYKRTMELLADWTGDPSPHVRRLVSEGTRPRLPLAGRIERFQKDPRPVIKLLEKLKDDPELYVRRSVANNINDIAKDNPDVAVAVLGRWQKNRSENVRWVVKHASRSLIKQGHPEILEILGAPADVKLKVGPLSLAPDRGQYKKGDVVQIECLIQSREKSPVALIVDYVIHYVKANGARLEKVFKLREGKIEPGGRLSISKKHTFKDTSGRKHYPGEHLIELQINGKRYARRKFQLRV